VPFGVNVDPLGEEPGPIVLPDGFILLLGPLPPAVVLPLPMPVVPELLPPIELGAAPVEPAVPLAPADPLAPAAPPPAPPAPPAPPPPPPAAKAMLELTARTEAKTIVVSFMRFPFVELGERRARMIVPGKVAFENNRTARLFPLCKSETPTLSKQVPPANDGGCENLAAFTE
jgi:hypothetical protein